jgi:hypothetical protein
MRGLSVAFTKDVVGLLDVLYVLLIPEGRPTSDHVLSLAP